MINDDVVPWPCALPGRAAKTRRDEADRTRAPSTWPVPVSRWGETRAGARAPPCACPDGQDPPTSQGSAFDPTFHTSHNEAPSNSLSVLLYALRHTGPEVATGLSILGSYLSAANTHVGMSQVGVKQRQYVVSLILLGCSR